MKKRNFNFSTKINKLKRRLKYFAEIVSKKEKQMREANARKLNCSIDDINKFYTETKDPSKQAMVFKGKIITPEDRKELYSINTWLEKIKVDGQEKASQKFIDFVQREQPLLKEYGEVFNNGVTPDGDGKLLDVISTPDGYNWEVWKVDSWEASRYLGGSFGDSVVKKNIGDNYTHQYEDKQISYRQHEARWCISYCKDDFWKKYYQDEGSKFIFLIRQDFNEDKFGKVAIQIKRSGRLVFWDSEDDNETFREEYEHSKYLLGELEKSEYFVGISGSIDEEKIKESEEGGFVYQGNLTLVDDGILALKKLNEKGVHTIDGDLCLEIEYDEEDGQSEELVEFLDEEEVILPKNVNGNLVLRNIYCKDFTITEKVGGDVTFRNVSKNEEHDPWLPKQIGGGVNIYVANENELGLACDMINTRTDCDLFVKLEGENRLDFVCSGTHKNLTIHSDNIESTFSTTDFFRCTEKLTVKLGAMFETLNISGYVKKISFERHVNIADLTIDSVAVISGLEGLNNLIGCHSINFGDSKINTNIEMPDELNSFQGGLSISGNLFFAGYGLETIYCPDLEVQGNIEIEDTEMLNDFAIRSVSGRIDTPEDFDKDIIEIG